MEEVKAGQCRADLFYRPNVVSIQIPPLRDRREDVPLLAEHFASRHAGARGASLTTEAREALLAWDWPGNVRELENAVAQALALNPSGTILPEDLPEPVRERTMGKRAGPRPRRCRPRLCNRPRCRCPILCWPTIRPWTS